MRGATSNQPRINSAVASKSPQVILTGVIRTWNANWELLLLCLPAIVCYILFNYIPMVGVLMAFKHFKPSLGIFGSTWAGIDNFLFLLTSSELPRIVRNTVGYNAAFYLLGTAINVIVALLLAEIKSRKALKFYQTTMMFPAFLSIIIIGYITYALFDPAHGILQQVMTVVGMKQVDIYTQGEYWPLIIMGVYLWKSLGIGSMMYFAALVGIDPCLYEAAEIDGAGKWKQVLHISIPSLVPLMIIFLILSAGSIFSGDFGLFYTIPRNIGILYNATDVVDTYVYRALKSASFEMGSAVGFLQSMIGFVLVLFTNMIVKKASPDNSMF